MTDHHVVLIDDRFPNAATAQWTHATPRAAATTRFFDTSPLTSDQHLLTIAADKTITLMTLATAGCEPLVQPRSLHLPLITSFASDCYDAYVMTAADALGFAEERFSNTTLRSALPIVTRYGFSMFVLTNYKDIFVQDYFVTDRVTDCATAASGTSTSQIVDHSWRVNCGGEHLRLNEQATNHMRHIVHGLSELEDKRTVVDEGEPLTNAHEECCGEWFVRQDDDIVASSSKTDAMAAAVSSSSSSPSSSDEGSRDDDNSGRMDDRARILERGRQARNETNRNITNDTSRWSDFSRKLLTDFLSACPIESDEHSDTN